MDFIDLADGLNQVTTTLLRHLTTTVAQDTGDDDFARIDGGEYEHSTAAPPQQQQSVAQEMGDDTFYSPEGMNATLDVDHPFLSKTAEAELYLLATNFLLCKLIFIFADVL